MEPLIDGLYLLLALRLIKLLALSESITDPQDVRPEGCILSFRFPPDVTRLLFYQIPTNLDLAPVRLELGMAEELQVDIPADKPRPTGHHEPLRLEMGQAKEMDTA
jgi:hypothetical protein